MRSQVNLLPTAVAIVSADSMSSQCKTRHRVLTGVHKRSASAVCHSWRVSEAFTHLIEQFRFVCRLCWR